MRARTYLTTSLLLAVLALAGCTDDDDASARSAGPVPQTYAATPDGLCEALGLGSELDDLGRLVDQASSHEPDPGGTTDRCVLDDDPPTVTLSSATGERVESEVVTVTVEVDVRTDGTAPPFDPRQFPLYRSDAAEASSESIDGWWDDGVLGTQTLVADDGTVHGYAASGAVLHDNLKVLVDVAAEHQSDPEPYQAAVMSAVERLLADVGPGVRGL